MVKSNIRKSFSNKFFSMILNLFLASASHTNHRALRTLTCGQPCPTKQWEECENVKGVFLPLAGPISNNGFFVE